MLFNYYVSKLSLKSCGATYVRLAGKIHGNKLEARW